MKRNLENYAKEGSKHMKPGYMLYESEIRPLMDKALSSPDGALDALLTAYNSGFEAGYRQRGRERKA
jgi:hypothetical protein